MNDTALYTFLLDFFPLVEEIERENAILGSTLQVIALDGLLDTKIRGRELAKLDLLLGLAADLGYTSPEVVTFLQRKLKAR